MSQKENFALKQTALGRLQLQSVLLQSIENVGQSAAVILECF